MAKKKKKLTKAGRIILDAIVIISLCLAIFSGYKLYQGIKTYQTAKNNYNDVRDTVIINHDFDTPGKENIDWDALRAINPNIAGWIYLEDSSIDYPFVYAENNDYWLRHLMDGTYNDAGTIFIDMANSRYFKDRNTVLYGHHMLQEPLMFAEVENYKQQDYYDTHKVFKIFTPEQNYEMYPLGGYVTTGTSGYIQLKFDNDEDYLRYVEDFINRSTFRSDETISAGDKIVLISTCSYVVDNGRYVLVGKLKEVEG